jgi:hypothetical protein
MVDLLKDFISSFSIKWFRGTDEIFSYIATLSDSGVSTIAKSVPGIFIQASEEIILAILPLSLTLGSALLPNQCLAFSFRQVKK